MDEQQRDTGFRPAGQIRIGDAEREVAMKRIVAAVGSGHLDVAEADRRMGAVYEARWPADLATLTGDLPGTAQPAPPPPPQSPPPPPRRPGAPPLLAMVLLVFGFLILFGHLIGPWTFPLLPIAIGVLLLMRWRMRHA